jgi:putative transposase
MPQHIIQRGNNREPCFFAEADYRFYLESLRDAAEKYQCAIHAYVLMTNHVHLLMTPFAEDALGHCLQSVGRRYVRYVNRVHHRTGTLWEGRYKASLVDTEGYLLTCYRYIELNPVRAGMVVQPGDYRWSSYHYNARGEQDGLLTPHPEYLRLGVTVSERQRAYRELFRTAVDQDALATIRDSLNRELVTGSERFKDKIEAVLNRRIRPGQAGRPRKDEVREEVGDYVVY